jgi:hypothetical protein
MFILWLFSSRHLQHEYYASLTRKPVKYVFDKFTGDHQIQAQKA